MASQPTANGAFLRALDTLTDTTVRMGGLCRESLEAVNSGLFSRDTGACNAAIAADSEIDDLEVAISNLVMHTVTEFSPVGSKLRLVVSCLRIATNLERVGDECVSIARRARQLASRAEAVEVQFLEPLFTAARRLFHDALSAFATLDTATARRVIERDPEIDQLCRDVTERLTRSVKREAGGLDGPGYANLAMMARSLERVGDHAKNIAEEVIFRLQPAPDDEIA